MNVALNEHTPCLDNFVQYISRPRAKHDLGRAPKVCLMLDMINFQEGASQSACQTLRRQSKAKVRGVTAVCLVKSHTGS
jgi:hypothetical protein